jgi:hypothetical protein
MTTRIPPARLGLAVLCAVCALSLLPAGAGAATVRAELRVLTPDRVIDPVTTYVFDGSATVPTTPDADCLGPPGGSGAEYSYDDPNALSLLATAARANRRLRPLALSDQFGFSLLICGIGGADASSGETFWYLKANHEEASVGADQLAVRDGDEVLFYLAPDNFPEPSPEELELIAPARAQAGSTFSVQVLEHACTTDQTTFEISCQTQPAVGATVGGATTGADGTAQVTAGSDGKVKLTATRGADIASEKVPVCVAEELDECPPVHGERLVGSPDGDRIKGTRGDDAIRSRGGADKVDLRKGGADALDCGPGRDTVLLKRSDRGNKIARDCERIRRR